MATRGLPYALLLLTIALTLPGVFASPTAPEPPSALVMQEVAVRYYPSPSGSYDTDVNLTYMISPDDPDQINGDLNYTLWRSVVPTLDPDGWLASYNISHLPVPGRPGWIYTSSLGDSGQTNNGSYFRYWNMTVSSYGGPPNTGPFSCLLGFDEATGTGHSQCGAPIIESPTGIAAAVVAKPSNATSTINITWPLSSSDPDPLNGSFDYTLKYNYFPPSGPPSLNVTLFGAHYTSGGYESFNNTFGLGGPVTVNLWVYAVDPLTHQWSNNTCIATINAQNLYESNGCGSMASYSYTPGGQVGATLPGFDMGLFASQTGLSLTLAGYIVGAIVTALIVLGAWKAAGIIGACIGFAGGLSVTALMGLLPFWLIIVIFMATVSIVVLLATKGGGE